MSLLRQVLDRFRLEEQPARRTVDPEARGRAAATIHAHAESHAALFERAARLRGRAERLEREGTPSDSASNRAGRAEDEARSSLSALRSRFAASRGDMDAFDLELRRHYPDFRLPEGS